MGCVGRVDYDQFDVATQQFLERIDRFDVGICRLRAFLAPFGDSRQLEIGMSLDERGVEYLPRQAESGQSCLDFHCLFGWSFSVRMISFVPIFPFRPGAVRRACPGRPV